MFAYYLVDDTLAIFEEGIRNSGMRGGKFLERGEYKDEANGVWWECTAFKVGSKVTVQSFPFIITGHDEYTAKYGAKMGWSM